MLDSHHLVACGRLLRWGCHLLVMIPLYMYIYIDRAVGVGSVTGKGEARITNIDAETGRIDLDQPA